MTGLILASLLSVQAPQASRYDLGERLKALESTWMTADEVRKREAVPFISQAVTSFFTQQFGPACRSLDSARAALLGRKLKPEDGITLRFIRGYVQPHEKAQLAVTWAYTLPDSPGVKVQIRDSSRTFKPGEDGVLEYHPFGSPVQPSDKIDYSTVITFFVGSETRSLNLLMGPRIKERAAALAASKDPDIAAIGTLIENQSAGRTELDLELGSLLKLGESLAEGKVKPKDVTDWPAAKEGQTSLRAKFPEQLDDSETLVIALHGAGGSENLFFEGYGRGLAVTEALKRKWAFIAPRSSASSVKDSLAWVKRVRGWTPKRVFVMGHSMGGALALQSGGAIPNPSAVVLFAPAGRQIPENLKKVPLYLAVGKQEILMLGASAQEIKRAREAEPGFRFNLVDPCEHLMIVADALPDAYKWLDETLGN